MNIFCYAFLSSGSDPIWNVTVLSMALLSLIVFFLENPPADRPSGSAKAKAMGSKRDDRGKSVLRLFENQKAFLLLCFSGRPYRNDPSARSGWQGPKKFAMGSSLDVNT